MEESLLNTSSIPGPNLATWDPSARHYYEPPFKQIIVIIVGKFVRAIIAPQPRHGGYVAWLLNNEEVFGLEQQHWFQNVLKVFKMFLTE